MSESLTEEREFLLQSIRDLDAEFAAGDIEEDDYRSLRDEYTARAAAVLRQLDSSRASGSSRPRSARKTKGGRPAWVRMAAVGGIVAILAGTAGFAVARSSGERTAGESASGSLPQTNADKITKAQVLTSEGKILDAVKLYDAVLKDDPQNVEALAQRGWLISRVDGSLVDSGLSSIDRAIAIDPTYAEAHFFRGVILMQAKQEPGAAADEFQKALDTNPPAEMATIFTKYRDDARQQAAAPTTTSPPTSAP
jgi:tetratricopeptide (TPR) repeat protein